MNKITIIPIVAIVAVGILGVSLMSTPFSPNVQSNDTFVITPTNPAEYGEDNWTGSVSATFTTIDPFEVKQRSELGIKGEILDVIKSEVVTHDGPIVEGEPIEPPLRTVTYVVEVTKVLKGTYDSKTIDIVMVVDSKIDYEVGDKVVFFLGDVHGEWWPYSGPHAMFKVKNGQAISDEKTLPEAALLNARN
ncbi:MAG: hypothetical protein J4F36_14365 [Nitrosopumilaceae archaeon]|nr:hypothetical protein [Nitrosopumilaceae archaeon]